jgi:ferric-dicitrate binding protein FerR (iron transport regulator)
LKDRQEYLKYLLARKKLTREEEVWLLNCLEGKDISDVEKAAAEDFELDLLNRPQTLDRTKSESLLHEIHSRIEIPKRSLAKLLQLHRVKIAVAATVILLAGAGYWLKQSQSAVPAKQEVVTTAGKRKKIQLADGSLITLEPNSRLSYPTGFTGYTRDVALTGEAFFEVDHNPEHPFVVHSPYANITVMGTSFNVEAYENEVTKVVVSTGRVKVQTNTPDKEAQAVIINANQSVVYNKSTNEIEKQEAHDDAVYYRQRHTGRFSYAGVSVARVIEEMERYYHIKVTLGEGMGRCVFYGYFQADDTVDKALSLVAMAMNATIKKTNNGKEYSILGGNCQ